jgi:DNA-directed RNA polymerase subunit D
MSKERWKKREKSLTMELKLLSTNKEGTVKFLAKGTTPTMLNTYRRMIVNKVPAMAIDEVEFSENSSAIYDEMLAHRLGLLVLKTDKKAYMETENCKCDGAGCAQCTLQLSLEAEGPCTVYAELIKSQDPNVYPAHKKAVVAKLFEDQNIKFIATVKMGTGKEHVKFSPGLMFYEKFPTLSKDSGKIQAIIENSPADAKFKGVKDVPVHELSRTCLSMLEAEGLVTTNNTDFLVTIEPWGQLSAKEIMESIVDVTNAQLDDLSKEIKKVK